jgi:hypothetical protein
MRRIQSASNSGLGAFFIVLRVRISIQPAAALRNASWRELYRGRPPRGSLDPRKAGSGGRTFAIFALSKRFLAEKNTVWAVQSPHKESYGRRHANYVQRLWAGIYLQLCRSAVFSGTRLLDTKALQALPPGKEGRSRGIRPPFGSFTGNTCDLFGLWPAYDRSF